MPTDNLFDCAVCGFEEITGEPPEDVSEVAACDPAGLCERHLAVWRAYWRRLDGREDAGGPAG